MKTRLANILLFPSTSPVLACLLFCLLMSVFLVVLCLGICVEVPTALFGYFSVRYPFKTVSVLSGLILGNICKPSVRAKETVCYILVSVLSIVFNCARQEYLLFQKWCTKRVIKGLNLGVETRRLKYVECTPRNLQFWLQCIYQSILVTAQGVPNLVSLQCSLTPW